VENLFVPGKMQRETIQSMQPVFGTLYSSMLSLFMAISGGDDWRNVMEPIAKVSFWTQFAFVFYIIFMVFGVLNVVTGVFVDKALAISQIDREFTIFEKIEQKKEYVHELKEFFCELDNDGDGQLTKREMQENLTNKYFQGHLETLDMDCNTAEELFDLLDVEQSGQIEVAEFVEGCLRVRGEARSIDVFALLMESRARHKLNAKVMDRVEERISSVEIAMLNLSRMLSRE